VKAARVAKSRKPAEPEPPIVFAVTERPHPSTIPGMTATRIDGGWTILRHRPPQTETTSRPLPPAEPKLAK